jgi:hypothetical protein
VCFVIVLTSTMKIAQEFFLLRVNAQNRQITVVSCTACQLFSAEGGAATGFGVTAPRLFTKRRAAL